ncbi:MAG: BMP family ABC transporter substrate-binding protein [Oscillospiraceae bacterium]|nr:BMP family ABC transporter substrate-binding protein [Oscillospiraceae bacterium]
MKKILALALALCTVFALAACGQSSAPAPAATEAPAASEAPAAAESSLKVAMITDYGDITDQSFNQTTYEACKAYCDANGLSFTYYKPAAATDESRVSMIERAIDTGYTVLVLPGNTLAPAIAATAPQYADISFIALDVSESDLTSAGLETIPANLYSAVYQEELCGYMAGYAAVKLGYTKLGFLGGIAFPAVVRYGYGFVQGADAAAAETGAEVSMNYAYGNQFYGDADITAAMDTWYGTGTEVVFACGGGIYSSAAEAAAKTGGKVIGVDVDQSGIIDGRYGAGMTVTSAMKGLAPTVKTMLAAVQSGSFAGMAGKVENLGLVSANPDDNYVLLPTATTQFGEGFSAEDYAKLVADMFDGRIKVSNDTSIAAADNAKVITVNDLGNLK